MDECCFSGDGDRGRITEDRSGQMDEEREREREREMKRRWVGGVVD